MFLNKKTIHLHDKTVVLYEVTALQRADYFDFLVEKEKESEGLEGAALTAKSIRTLAESQAWLVSRSLWNSDRERDVDEINSEVSASWGKSALEEAVAAILDISGMASQNDNSDDDHEDAEPLEK
ncbi:hypothetical protein G3341_08675 [Providencia vermicola]|uniref:phage minor tail protein domain-containing protein n=1 Tax=Providencia vermicola TaxID=333965 RepID=UPI0013A796A6|nr:phage minor tail protein G [Providencia vermicola]QIC15746.1 hypothetical protein G3341_08675 [Providencia vermicola]